MYFNMFLSFSYFELVFQTNAVTISCQINFTEIVINFISITSTK